MISEKYTSSNFHQIRVGLPFCPRLPAKAISKLQHYHKGTERNDTTVERALAFPFQHQEKLQGPLCSPHSTPRLSAILSSSYNNWFLPPAFSAADFQHQGDRNNLILFPVVVTSISAAVPSPLGWLGDIFYWELRLQSPSATGFVNSDGICLYKCPTDFKTIALEICPWKSMYGQTALPNQTILPLVVEVTVFKWLAKCMGAFWEQLRC